MEIVKDIKVHFSIVSMIQQYTAKWKMTCKPTKSRAKQQSRNILIALRVALDMYALFYKNLAHTLNQNAR